MYVPKAFQETRTELLHEFIRSHPFGTLVTVTAAGLEANHIPFLLAPEPTPRGTLRGHVARANPVWRDLVAEPEVLVIFQGPAGYVSPSWYPSKQQTGKLVPTWNYTAVHAYGPIKVIEQRDRLLSLVEELTDLHEAGREEVWRVSDAPADYIEKLLDHIVGIEIPIARLIGKWKLSQNRSAEDRAGLVVALEGQGGDSATALANLVRQTEDC